MSTKKYDLNSVGGRLDYAIKEVNKTTSYKVAKSTGFSESTISRIIRNKTTPNLTTINALCNHLGVNPEWVLSGEGEIANTLSVDRADLDSYIKPSVDKGKIYKRSYKHLSISELVAVGNALDIAYNIQPARFDPFDQIPSMREALVVAILSECERISQWT